MAAEKAITTIHTARPKHYSQYGQYATTLAAAWPPTSGTARPNGAGADRRGSGWRRKGQVQIPFCGYPVRLWGGCKPDDADWHFGKPRSSPIRAWRSTSTTVRNRRRPTIRCSARLQQLWTDDNRRRLPQSRSRAVVLRIARPLIDLAIVLLVLIAKRTSQRAFDHEMAAEKAVTTIHTAETLYCIRNTGTMRRRHAGEAQT